MGHYFLWALCLLSGGANEKNTVLSAYRMKTIVDSVLERSAYISRSPKNGSIHLINGRPRQSHPQRRYGLIDRCGLSRYRSILSQLVPQNRLRHKEKATVNGAFIDRADILTALVVRMPSVHTSLPRGFHPISYPGPDREPA